MIDLSKFCDPETAGHKIDMSVPFRVGAYRYATDGRICVRVPDTGERPDTPYDAGTRPSAAGVFRPFVGPMLPWPGESAGVPGTTFCPKCAEDDEYVDPNPEDETTHCEVCGGDGIVPDVDKMVGPLRIAGQYDRLIRDLPGVRYDSGQETAPHQAGRIDIRGSVQFQFDGGEGVVMGKDDAACKEQLRELDEKLAYAAQHKRR